MTQISQIFLNVVSKPNLQVFPNPSPGVFHIHSSDGIFGLTVTDLSGRVLYSEQGLFYQKDINLSNYPAGMYLLKAGGVVMKLLKE